MTSWMTGPDAQEDAFGRRSLSRTATDRDAATRREPGLLERLARDPRTRLLLADDRGRIALEAPTPRPSPDAQGPGGPAAGPPGAGPVASDVSDTTDGWRTAPRGSGPGTGPGRPRLAPLTAADLDVSATGAQLLYLGREQDEGGRAGAAWIGLILPGRTARGVQDAEGAARAHPELDALLERYPLSSLRAVGAELSARDAGLATPAVALASWHARARFCAACGARSEAAEAGWARCCTGCGAVSFPRTDPAVIIAVTDDADRLVLVHGAAWEPRRYSVVAGFVEAGESAEAAVVREVHEETGLRVAAVEQVESQPWPFPRSLMLGYRARLGEGGARPRPDGEEVTDVLILSRDELSRAVDEDRVVLPGATSIARRLIEDWYGSPL